MKTYNFEKRQDAISFIKELGFTLKHSLGDWGRTYYMKPKDVGQNNMPLAGAPFLQFWKHPILKKYQITVFGAEA